MHTAATCEVESPGYEQDKPTRPQQEPGSGSDAGHVAARAGPGRSPLGHATAETAPAAPAELPAPAPPPAPASD